MTERDIEGLKLIIVSAIRGQSPGDEGVEALVHLFLNVATDINRAANALEVIAVNTAVSDSGL